MTCCSFCLPCCAVPERIIVKTAHLVTASTKTFESSSSQLTESEISSQCRRNRESSNIHLDFRIDVPLHPQTHCTSASLLLGSLSAPCLPLPSHILHAFHALPLPPKLSSAASRLHGSVQLRSMMMLLARLMNQFAAPNVLLRLWRPKIVLARLPHT